MRAHRRRPRVGGSTTARGPAAGVPATGIPAAGVPAAAVVSERRTVRAELHAGPRDEPGRQDGGPDVGVAAERFREALARWASTVTLVAVREPDTGRVHATTATSFAPVSTEPPQVLFALGPGAQVVPFLEVGGAVGVSLLAEDQQRWATIFADAFPVATPEWSFTGGAPALPGALVALACTVRSVDPVEGGAALVVSRVQEVTLGDGARPLLYWDRGYGRPDRP